MAILFNDMIFDYSKKIITDETKKHLLELTDVCKLQSTIEAMFTGEKINGTENRAVLHMALRNVSEAPVTVEKVRQQMKTFCEKGHHGEWKGYTGKNIKHIVDIGIAKLTFSLKWKLR